MTIPERCLLLAAVALLAAGSMERWKPADIRPALAYAHRCGANSRTAAAVTLWSAHPERQPCPAKS